MARNVLDKQAVVTTANAFLTARWLLALLTSGVLAGPLHRQIDQQLATAASFSPRSDDAEFFRRVNLDFTGRIPDPAAVRAFLASTAPDKRSLLIDQLIASDAFATHWTDRLSVMLLERRDEGKVTDAAWRAYLTGLLREHPRWDKIVHDLLAATGEGEARAAMKFWGKIDHHAATEDIARLFLGMDLKCAKCHDHPSVKDWEQRHYWGLYAYLNQTKEATNTKDKQAYLVETVASKKVDFESVFEVGKKQTGPQLPGRDEVPIPAFEEGEAFEQAAADGLPGVPKFRPRALLARDMTDRDHTAFARNSVNRFWALLMGRGLVHPLDQLHGKNPPSHPALLELLTRAFADHAFDIKWLLREIALSEAYQRSSRLPEGVDRVEPTSYRVALPKALTPEQLLYALLTGTGNREWVQAMQADPGAEAFDLKGYFTGTHAELPPSFAEVRKVFLQAFAAPPGEAEVDFVAGASKSLFLMNDRLILHWLQRHGNNLVDRLATLTTAGSVAEELYLSVLSRPPLAVETETVSTYLAQNDKHREGALADLAWALLTSTEFRFNH